MYFLKHWLTVLVKVRNIVIFSEINTLIIIEAYKWITLTKYLQLLIWTIYNRYFFCCLYFNLICLHNLIINKILHILYKFFYKVFFHVKILCFLATSRKNIPISACMLVAWERMIIIFSPICMRILFYPFITCSLYNSQRFKI